MEIPMPSLFRFSWIVLFILSVPMSWATPAQVLLIRHGEKLTTGADLSPDGQKRAKLLVEYFKTNPDVTKFGKPVAIYAASIRKHFSEHLMAGDK